VKYKILNVNILGNEVFVEVEITYRPWLSLWLVTEKKVERLVSLHGINTNNSIWHHTGSSRGWDVYSNLMETIRLYLINKVEIT
jgi:hypothetical protein